MKRRREIGKRRKGRGTKLRKGRGAKLRKGRGTTLRKRGPKRRETGTTAKS
jgi:hypothetical protein